MNTTIQNLSPIGSELFFAIYPHYRTKFTLYNADGVAKAYYLVDSFPLKQEALETKKSITHSIIIIDRSGSMTQDIQALKETLIKLLTLDEYRNTELLVSLISYASHQDVTCHFQRVNVSEIMALNSPQLQTIQTIQAGGLTCISQALELAESLIQENELTAITLHSDGYANDPSISTESQALDQICENLKQKQVFLNTISYAQADFQRLDKLANSLSGSCIQAGNIKQVYDALYSASKLLQDAIFNPIEEPLVREYDYQVFVSSTARKINGCAGTLKILGLKLSDHGTLYKYKKINAEEYATFNEVPIRQTDESVFAFARTHLAEGKLNQAKYALYSTFDQTLIHQYAKAFSNSELVKLAQDLEQAIFNQITSQNHEILTVSAINPALSLLEVIYLLEEYQDHILINIQHLQQHYTRRELKRVSGVRDAEGNIVKPWLRTELIDQNPYVQMGNFEINRNTATINLLITRPVRLVREEDNQIISEVAGILLNNLKCYNNYTVVGDGELNLKALRVKLSNKKVFEALKTTGILGTATAFDFQAEYEINLEQFPLVSVDQYWGSFELSLQELAEAKVLLSLINAHLQVESDTYTVEQLLELRKHYLSKNLYLNFPKSLEYLNLEEAVNQGLVDSRISYKIDVGNADILNLGKLLSANQFLERAYEVYGKVTGEKLEKPTFDQLLDQSVILAHKTLSKRTEWTAIDTLMKSIFDDFLGLVENGKVAEILTRIQAQVDVQKLMSLLRLKWQAGTNDKITLIELLSQIQIQLDAWIECIYRQRISPIVFYIGATGLFPDEWNVVAQTAREISARYEGLNFSKAEQEGTFFEVGDVLISVYPEREYFSTK